MRLTKDIKPKPPYRRQGFSQSVRWRGPRRASGILQRGRTFLNVDPPIGGLAILQHEEIAEEGSGDIEIGLLVAGCGKSAIMFYESITCHDRLYHRLTKERCDNMAIGSLQL
jgi:hypothetical protein